MADEDSNKEVNLTYETLFEFLRREKNRVELQVLEPSFYRDFLDYYKTKKDLLQEKQGKLTMDQGEDIIKLTLQIENIKKIMKELYGRREKKIINLALMSTRSSSGRSKEAMLDFEAKLYDGLITMLSNFRNGVLLNLLNHKSPFIEEQAITSAAATTDADKKTEANNKKDELIVRFLSPVPRFVGEELESYGPFSEEEISTLPIKIADLLIKKNMAEEINEE